MKVSPIRLIRKEFDGADVSTFWAVSCVIATAFLLIMIAARYWKLGLWTTMSFAVAIAIFSLVAWGLIKLICSLPSKWFAIKFVLLAQGGRARLAIIQITALGIALMALLFVLLLRADFLSAWQGNIPSDAPNRFIINVQADQKQGLTQSLQNAGVRAPEFYPMIRGRLIEVNGKEVMPNNYTEENARRLVNREFNLSYADQLPIGN